MLNYIFVFFIIIIYIKWLVVVVIVVVRRAWVSAVVADVADVVVSAQKRNHTNGISADAKARQVAGV
jgi:hypothetical protein